MVAPEFFLGENLRRVEGLVLEACLHGRYAVYIYRRELYSIVLYSG